MEQTRSLRIKEEIEFTRSKIYVRYKVPGAERPIVETIIVRNEDLEKKIAEIKKSFANVDDCDINATPCPAYELKDVSPSDYVDTTSRWRF